MQLSIVHNYLTNHSTNNKIREVTTSALQHPSQLNHQPQQHNNTREVTTSHAAEYPIKLYYYPQNQQQF
jgi:hypothetical protein